MVRGLCSSASQEEEKKWTAAFGDAYTDSLEKRAARGLGSGPVDVEAPGNRCLMVLAMAKGEILPDWERLSLRWNTEFPELRAAAVLEKVQNPGRARAIWRKIEERMKSRGIPLRRSLILRMEEDTPKEVAKRAIFRKVRNAQLNPELEAWILKELKILHTPRRTFFGLRNAGATLRAAKMTDILAEVEESESRIVGGHDFSRVAGCAKIPIRRTTTEKVRTVKGCVSAVGKLIAVFQASRDSSERERSQDGEDTCLTIGENIAETNNPPHRTHQKSTESRGFRPSDRDISEIHSRTPAIDSCRQKHYESFSEPYRPLLEKQQKSGSQKQRERKSVDDIVREVREAVTFCAEDKSPKET